MRHPVYIDRLDPDDQRTVKRWHAAIAVFYPAVALLVAVIVAVRIDIVDSRVDEMRRDRVAGTIEANALVVSSGVGAAEPTGIARCAWRDLQIVTAIEAHGEAQDIPAARLQEAFTAMMKARAACSAGHVAEALAMYDGIVIAPVQSTER